MALQLVVDTESPIPIYEQIVEQIESAILSHALNPGESLPTVRQLALDLEINFNTVMRAYKLLEQKHLVVSSGRKGTFVRKDAEMHLSDNLQKEVLYLLGETIDQLLKKGATNSLIKKSFAEALDSQKRRS